VITPEARDRRGELVTVADLPLEFVEKTGPWVEVVPPGSDVGFTVHESEIHR
jgi:hypothetical protein